MEFLVEFEVHIPDDAPSSAVESREAAEAVAAAKLEREGHLVRVWRPAGTTAGTIIGLYQVETAAELDGLLGALPLAEWMDVKVIPLEPHPNDPARADRGAAAAEQLPDPRLSPILRLEATLGEPLDLGQLSQGHRRIVPLTSGTFTGPELSGKLVPGSSADWQLVRPDGTAFGDIRYTLRTDRGDLLYVQSQSVRHGGADVLARLGRGEQVGADEYTFRTSTRIETGVPDLDWLNKGIFISVGGRKPAGVIYETYLVG